ncbi:MAG: GNAT family N-acetyltransferase [Methanomassiliicoccales archaeon]|nr:MAG: GNAT family N-acetyltransferase [Methanomassiliicoccales archaeon]
MEIKLLNIEDYEMMNKVFEDSGLSYRPEGRDSREEIGRQMSEFSDLFLGAFEGDELIGLVVGTDDGRKGWINRLAVSPEHQRKGVGSALVRELESAFQKRKKRIISILVELPNEASMSFFEEAGYEQWDSMAYLSKREDERV